MQVPDDIYDQFLWREDCQIQGQELLSTLLILGVFGDMVKGNLLTCYTDNMSILHALTKGSASKDAPDLNLLVGRAWLHVAKQQIGWQLFRVESKANLTDGPTRDDCSLMDYLEAEWMQPKLQSWCIDVWKPLKWKEWDDMMCM